MISFGTASLLEIVWTAIALGGFVVALHCAGHAAGDRRSVIRSGWNGYRRRWARNRLITATGCAVILGLFVVLGIEAMLTPGGRGGTSPAALIAATVFIATELLVTGKALMDRRDRTWIMTRLDAEYDAWRGKGW